MSSIDTWMPLYIGDYLADTGHLTTIQHGAYLLLIMHYWRTGSLPARDGELAAIARLSIKQWSKISPQILNFFVQENYFLRHKRIDAEIERAKSVSTSNKAKASAAASARWSKKNNQEIDA